jgi:ASC-1-like (ASCH) protein
MNRIKINDLYKMNQLSLTLNDPWFDLMKEGKKIYEGRRNTEKIRKIKKNDIIQINHHTNPSKESFSVIVDEILHFKTFEEALNSLPIDMVLPIDNIDIKSGIEIYFKYVSLETQIKDGIIMLKVHVID